MTGLLIVVAAAAAVILWAVLAQRPSAARSVQERGRMRPSARRPESGFAGVGDPPRYGQFTALSIMPGRACCAAAQARAKRRYLKDSAPTLPLESCDASRCQCAFAEHADRRIASHTDRRVGVGLQSELYGSQGEPERRRRRGRRVTDRFKRSPEITGGGSQ